MKPTAITALAILLLGGGFFALWQLDASKNVAELVKVEENDSASPWVTNSTTSSGVADRSNAPQTNPALLKLIDSSLTWQSRVASCDQILKVDNLSDEDVDVLFRLYRHQPSSESRKDWYVVLNAIMGNMCSQGIGSDRLVDELSSVLADPKLPVVSRDYAAQYLANWLVPATPGAPGEKDTDRRLDGIAALVTAISDKTSSHTSIPGTALMALADLDTRAEASEMVGAWQKLVPVVEQWFEPGSSATVPNCVSALQAVSMADVRELHPMVRRLANNSHGNPSVRLSAVAALGNYGDLNDKPTLVQIAKAEPRLRYAVAAALERISQK